MRVLTMAGLALAVAAWGWPAEGDRPRARGLGIAPGVFEPGPLNAITDVKGVRVGQVTLIEGERVRTGVTAIVPHEGNVFRDKVPAGIFVGNAFGKLAGSTQVEELGTLETPIVLTNTLSVGTVVEAVVAETLAHPDNADVRSVNAVVGETNDGRLNDIRGRQVTREQVRAAIRSASPGAVAEGAVGAGTGTVAFGWKGGIGTASRLLPPRYGNYTLGVLVQTNFGGVLTVDGVPVGKELGRYLFAPPEPASKEDGSCMIVVATDAPLDARDLKRLAARAIFGLARTGSSFTNGSGDYAIAFSTSPEGRVRHGDPTPRPRAYLPAEAVSPLFQAALEATEEAVYNSPAGRHHHERQRRVGRGVAYRQAQADPVQVRAGPVAGVAVLSVKSDGCWRLRSLAGPRALRTRRPRSRGGHRAPWPRSPTRWGQGARAPACRPAGPA